MFVDLPRGIPTHVGFIRAFVALDPTQFQARFVIWMQAVTTVLSTGLIAVYGKAVHV